MLRTIDRSTLFKRDYKRIKANPRYSKVVEALLIDVLEFLMEDVVLPDKNQDHGLTGNWKGCRECHLKPDLLLIY